MDQQQGDNTTPQSLSSDATKQSVPQTTEQGTTGNPAPTASGPTSPSFPASSPIPTPVSSPTTPPTKHGSSKMMIIAIIIIVLLLIGAGAFFFMHKQAPQQMNSMPQPTMQPKPTTSAQIVPTISPVTSANVDQTLNNADTKMQQVVSQANSDINSVNSINTSQDSTNGL